MTNECSRQASSSSPSCFDERNVGVTSLVLWWTTKKRWQPGIASFIALPFFFFLFLPFHFFLFFFAKCIFGEIFYPKSFCFYFCAIEETRHGISTPLFSCTGKHLLEVCKSFHPHALLQNYPFNTNNSLWCGQETEDTVCESGQV